MKELGITAVFGFVALLLSFGIPVPESLFVFHVIAATAAMAGYPTGVYCHKYMASKIFSILVPISAAIVTVVCLIEYTNLIHRNLSGELVVWILGGLLAVSFFGFSLTMAAAGVGIQQVKGDDPP